MDGGPVKDGIPALVHPNHITRTEVDASVLHNDDLVLGAKNGNIVRAYPHIILDRHEIIHDNIGDISVAVTY